MRYAPLFVLVLLATGVASCDSTKPANPLTEPETVALLREIFLLMEDAGGDSSTVDCSVGGQATVTELAYDRQNGDTARFNGLWTIIPTDCEANVVSDTLILNGKPNVRYTVEAWAVFDVDLDVVRGAARAVFGGAMKWRRRNGDTDTCSVDLTFESTEFDEDEGFKGDFRGRMCGLDLAIDDTELLW